MEIIALIDQPPVIKKILDHLGLPSEIPKARPARPPPVDEDFDDSAQLDLYQDELYGVDDPNVYAE